MVYFMDVSNELRSKRESDEEAERKRTKENIRNLRRKKI